MARNIHTVNFGKGRVMVLISGNRRSDISWDSRSCFSWFVALVDLISMIIGL
jgi:hypothetical protein